MANVTNAPQPHSTPRPGGAVGYLRIATEEAFAPPEMFRLYVDMLEKGDARRSRLQEPVAAFISAARASGRRPSPSGCRTLARVGLRTWTHPASTSKSSRSPRPACRSSIARRRSRWRSLANDQLVRSGRPPSLPLYRPRRRSAAGSAGRRQGNRTRHQEARLQGRHHQFAHPWRISRRSQILGDL